MGEPTTSELERRRYNQLLERLGSALLSLKDAVDKLRQAQEKAHADLLSQGNAALTQVVLARNDIAEARKDIARCETEIASLERDLQDARRELTPVQGTPIPSELRRRDESIELGADGAKVPVGVLASLGRGLHWVMLGILIGCALIAVALWASGERVQVIQREAPAAAPPRVEGPAPALRVPDLKPPRIP